MTISIHRDQCKGKFIQYLDKDGKTRIEKCVKITGNYMTLKNIIGKRTRVHAKQIQGVYYRKKLRLIFFPKLDYNKNRR